MYCTLRDGFTAPTLLTPTIGERVVIGRLVEIVFVTRPSIRKMALLLETSMRSVWNAVEVAIVVSTEVTPDAPRTVAHQVVLVELASKNIPWLVVEFIHAADAWFVKPTIRTPYPGLAAKLTFDSITGLSPRRAMCAPVRTVADRPTVAAAVSSVPYAGDAEVSTIRPPLVMSNANPPHTFVASAVILAAKLAPNASHRNSRHVE
jgi:hypothetical protein